MIADEGVIKFEAVHSPGSPPMLELGPLVAWRRMLYRLGHIGRDPARYGGAGFGNVSQRMATGSFAITGTQTGGVELLGPAHFCSVERFELSKNRVFSVGPLLPSSEAMTHGMIYELSAAVNVVLHVHSPDIWRNARALRLPTTGERVPYGTPAMAREVERLLRESDLRRRRVFAMAGHEDGVIAFGRSVEDAGQALLAVYATALQ